MDKHRQTYTADAIRLSEDATIKEAIDALATDDIDKAFMDV
jgi:hypothetical protein